jgi:hypothetical protein
MTKKQVSFSRNLQVRMYSNTKTPKNFYLGQNTPERTGRTIPPNAPENNFLTLKYKNGGTKKIYAPEFYNLENGLRLFRTKEHEKNRENLFHQLVKKYPSKKAEIANAYRKKDLLKRLQALRNEQKRRELLKRLQALRNEQKRRELLKLLKRLQALRNEQKRSMATRDTK